MKIPDKFWYLLAIVRVIWKYGFSNYALRFILTIFQDNKNHLAEDLSFYDELNQNSKSVHTSFTKNSTTMTWRK